MRPPPRARARHLIHTLLACSGVADMDDSATVWANRALMKAALKQIAHGLRCVRKLHDIKHIRHEQAAWRKRRRQRPTSPIQQWRGHIRPVVGASDGRMEVAVGWSLRVTALSSAEHIHCAYGCKDEYPSTGER